MHRRVFALLSPLALALAAFARTAPPEQAEIRFNRDIRPILSDRCFACHGPDKNKRQASLRLDLPNLAVIPGDVVNSELTRRVLATDESQMPPAAFHKPLTSDETKLLLRWIDDGAAYEKHWSFTALSYPPPPNNGGDSSRYRGMGAIDAFLDARLAKEGIAPSPEADRRTLLRRLSLDLIGLPPTPGEMSAFLADASPSAYEKQVDRLLASPHYGERMAIPWLDAVRYADTVGFHGDQNMNAWAYRDWVIDAFNANMPFDRFTTEQLAGDLLPNPTESQRVATCFNRLNMVTREGGAQPKEYLHKYATDRVRTVGMAWMGLTTGCAECHDHKFDPLTQKDFYSLAAFFADIKQWGVYADYGYTPNPDLRGVGNDHPFYPELVTESPYLKARIASKQREIDALSGKLLMSQSWLRELNTYFQKFPDGWERAERVTRTESGDVSVTLLASAGSVASVRLDVFPEGGTAFLKGATSGSVNLGIAVVGKDGKAKPIAVRHAAASAFEPIYRNSFALLGVHRGWRLSGNDAKSAQSAVYRLARPVALAEGESLRVTLPKCELASFQLAASPLVPRDPDGLSLPGKDLAARDYLLATVSDGEAFADALACETEIVACRGGKTPVMVTEAVKTPLVMRVVPRGNWQDETAPVAPPATPGFLSSLPPPAPRGYPGESAKRASGATRLDLARWLTSRENPLTARVFVNRLWKQFFGVGLSASVEDVGAQGEPPVHPELLDWLASDFQKDWNVKRAVKNLVLSRAYRRSSVARPDLKDRDPQNRLVAAQNPRRLEAELVRDNALAVAGLLNPALGGPPCKPYQPAGYYAPLQFPDRDYAPDATDSQWRRGVYMHVQRTFLHPMLASFDATSRDEPTCTRTQANTPQQALTLLNDPEFVEAARVLAGKLGGGSDAEKLGVLYQRALARWPKDAEKRSLLTFLGKMRESFRARPEDAKKLLAIGNAPQEPGDPAERAAWTQVCRAVLNLHEVITRY